LVFPLIDNLGANRTILDIVNRADTDVWLKGFIVAHEAGGTNPDDDPSKYHKKDFLIKLTQKQPIIWDTSVGLGNGIPPNDDHLGDNFVQAFNDLKGYMVIWAVDGDKTQREKQWNELKGDAVVFNPVRGIFRYNAIPHQALIEDPEADPYVLRLNGEEYAAMSERILCEGFARGFAGLDGILAVANVGVNFITSTQPAFDINFGVWNEDEVYASRHQDFDQFEQYDLEELQLSQDEINGNKFQFATSATDGEGEIQALWAVFYQYTSAGPTPRQSFGGQCFIDPAEEFLADTTITLSVPTQ
jgi:hypothetical protein